MFNLVEGSIFPLVIWVLRIINENTRDAADIIQWILRANAPIFCFSFGILNATNRDVYKSVYGENSIKGPFDWDIAGADMFFLALHTLVWLIGVFLIEYLKNIQWIRNIVNARDPGPSDYRPDGDVEREKERV